MTNPANAIVDMIDRYMNFPQPLEEAVDSGFVVQQLGVHQRLIDTEAAILEIQRRIEETMWMLTNYTWPARHVVGLPSPSVPSISRDSVWVIPDNADFSWGIDADQFRRELAYAQACVKDIVARTTGTPLCEQELPAEGTE